MSLRTRSGALLLAVAVLLGGGVATASWLASGTGPAKAQAATVQNLIVSAAVPAATLYPEPSGGYGSSSVGTVVATVDNPNVFAVDVTTVTLGTTTITPLAGRTCAAGSIVPADGVTTRSLSPAVHVPASSTGTSIAVPGALEMLPTAEDGCQGASVSVVMTVSGAAS